MTIKQAAEFPGIDNIPFLRDDFIRKYSAIACLEEQDVEEILRLKDVLLHKESFVRLLWELHDHLYVQELPFHEVMPENPKLGRLLGDGLRGVFYYLLILSGIPLAFERYRKRGWPEDMRDEVFSDLAVWVANHKRNFGTPGFAWMVVGWFQSHINLTLLSFGRLQFNTSCSFPCKVKVFRNRHTQETIAMVSAPVRFNADGICDDLQETPSPGSWTSSFADHPQSWAGNKITPDGRVQKHPSELLKTEWDMVLSQGDPVINIHIPECGPLNPETCHDSMRRACKFFAEYLPDYRWKAFFCDSWLLDPQLQKILPKESNILAFQRDSYLLPFPGEADTIFRCFGVKAARDGIATVPLRTSLQHALVKFLKDGGRFHYGAFVILREDTNPFKTNPYKQKF